MKNKLLNIKYFASLKDKTGKSSETIEVDVNTTHELFDFLDSVYHFKIDKTFIKVAVNDEFKNWTTPLTTGDVIVFITPVAGG